MTTPLKKKEIAIANKNIIVKWQDFTPLTQLGKGSFGTVYLVRENKSGILFAMKTLDKSNHLQDSWFNYLKTEREIVAQTENPFIIKLRYAF
jgi:serine/threonine protein kinase